MRDITRIKDGQNCQWLSFWCEACGFSHTVKINAPDNSGWGFNGSREAPTLTPSVKLTLPRPSHNPAEVNDRTKDIELCCHSFVRAGRIEYLSDCTHALAGQTVDLKEFPEGWGVRTED